MCCRVLQCVAVCCSVLQCVAVRLNCIMISLLWPSVCCVREKERECVCARTGESAREREQERERAGEWKEREKERKKERENPVSSEWRSHACVWHTATHCDTCSHMRRFNATRCNTLQHTATHCNTLQHTATQPIAFGSSFNLIRHPQSNSSLFNRTRQQRRRELDIRLKSLIRD